jgi:hypothetical protein
MALTDDLVIIIPNDLPDIFPVSSRRQHNQSRLPLRPHQKYSLTLLPQGQTSQRRRRAHLQHRGHQFRIFEEVIDLCGGYH